MKTQTTSGALIAQASHAIYPSAPSGHCVRLKWFSLVRRRLAFFLWRKEEFLVSEPSF